MVVDAKTKKTIAICAAIGLVLFIIGILIGFFSGRGSTPDAPQSQPQASMADLQRHCWTPITVDGSGSTFMARFLERRSQTYACILEQSACADFALPRNYTAVHLNGLSIDIDGHLDDQAWQEVTLHESILLTKVSMILYLYIYLFIIYIYFFFLYETSSLL